MSRLRQVGIMGSFKGFFSTCSVSALVCGFCMGGTSPASLLTAEGGNWNCSWKWHLRNCSLEVALWEWFLQVAPRELFLEVAPRELFLEVPKAPAGREKRGSPRQAQLSFGTEMGSKPSSCVRSGWAEGKP